MKQKCSVAVCANWSVRTVLTERYCFDCGASVEQAAYLQSLPPRAAEQVLYRHTFSIQPPPGVTLPEPLGGGGRKGRRRR